MEENTRSLEYQLLIWKLHAKGLSSEKIARQAEVSVEDVQRILDEA